MPTYVWYADPGHSWLEVPLSHIHPSVLSKISRYSHRSGNVLYLEEDCDAQEFLNSLSHSPIGTPVTFQERYTDNDSVVRSFPRWNGIPL